MTLPPQTSTTIYKSPEPCIVLHPVNLLQLLTNLHNGYQASETPYDRHKSQGTSLLNQVRKPMSNPN